VQYLDREASSPLQISIVKKIAEAWGLHCLADFLLFSFPLVLRSGDFTRFSAWKYVNREKPQGILVILSKTLEMPYLGETHTSWILKPEAIWDGFGSKIVKDYGFWVIFNHRTGKWNSSSSVNTSTRGEVACLHILEWFISLPFLVLVPTDRQTYWK